MLQTALKRDILTLSENNPESIVKSVKNYINEHNCPYMSVDISSLNVIDASKVTILSSTYHFVKYPEGHITWHVCSETVKNLVKPLNLGNIDFLFD